MIVISDLLVKYNVVPLFLSKTINYTRGRILSLLSFRLMTTKNDTHLLIYRCLLHFVRCPYSLNISSSLVYGVPLHNHVPLITIIFPQKREFLKLCLPLNYLTQSAFRQLNGIQRKTKQLKRNNKAPPKYQDTRYLAKGKYEKYVLEAKYSSYSQTYQIYAVFFVFFLRNTFSKAGSMFLKILLKPEMFVKCFL